MKIVAQIAVVLISPFVLSSCLLLSPYGDQVLASRTEPISFNARTIKTNDTLTVECMPTNRFGPTTSRGPWRAVNSIPVSTYAETDDGGYSIFSVGKRMSLPVDCWFHNRSNDWYYTSIRVLQTGYLGKSSYEYYTVDKDGPGCVADSVTTSRSWFSWLTAGCVTTQRDNSTALRYVVLRTRT